MLELTAVLATALAISVAGLLRARRATATEKQRRRLEAIAALHDLTAVEHDLTARLVVAEAEAVIYRALARALETGDTDE